MLISSNINTYNNDVAVVDNDDDNYDSIILIYLQYMLLILINIYTYRHILFIEWR